MNAGGSPTVLAAVVTDRLIVVFGAHRSKMLCGRRRNIEPAAIDIRDAGNVEQNYGVKEPRDEFHDPLPLRSPLYQN